MPLELPPILFSLLYILYIFIELLSIAYPLFSISRLLVYIEFLSTSIFAPLLLNFKFA